MPHPLTPPPYHQNDTKSCTYKCVNGPLYSIHSTLDDHDFDDILLEEPSYDFKEFKEEEEEVKETKENEPIELVNGPSKTVRSVSISDEPLEDKPPPPKIIKLTKPPGSNGTVYIIASPNMNTDCLFS